MPLRFALSYGLLILALLGSSIGFPMPWREAEDEKMVRSLGIEEGGTGFLSSRAASESDGNESSSTALAILWYILGDRGVVLAANLVVGSFFVLLILSIPWLKRHNISFGWFRWLDRDVRHEGFEPLQSLTGSSPSSGRNSTRRPITSIFSFESLPSPPSIPPSQNSDIILEEMRVPAGAPTSGFRSGNTSVSRSTSNGSRRMSLTTSMNTQRTRRLEPLRLSGVPVPPARDADVQSVGDVFPSLSDLPTPPSIVATRGDESDISLQNDLADLTVPETPTSPTGGSMSTENSSPVTPGRLRPPTYRGTTFSQASHSTLPAYVERPEDSDRMSITSRAPTYRSRSSLTIRGPRTPFRFTRPPLPPLNYPPEGTT